MKIVIPCAGNGQRFKDEGYKEPKPLIDVCGKSMITRVIESLYPQYLNNPTKVIVVSRAEHNVPDSVLGDTKGIVIRLNHETEGAVQTVLEAIDFITDEPLIIANCDQLVFFDRSDFIKKAKDASLITFNSTNPHHSYARVKDGKVVEVKEKEVISDHAIAGIYYFKHGTDFTRYARQMIEQDIRYKGEFYISPLFNLMIEDGKTVNTYEVDVKDKHMLGVPYELKIFLEKVGNGEVSL